MADATAAQKEKEKPDLKVVPKEGDAGAGKRKVDFMSLVVLGLVTLNLAVLGGLGLYLKKIATRMDDLEDLSQRTPAASSHSEEGIVGKELESRVTTLYPIESFLVNIQSEQGSKFLQTQIELELPDAGLEEEITRKKAAIRDAIIVHLSSRNFSELRETDGLQKLKKDLMQAINQLLSTGKIKDLYFTQFHFN